MCLTVHWQTFSIVQNQQFAINSLWHSTLENPCKNWKLGLKILPQNYTLKSLTALNWLEKKTFTQTSTYYSITQILTSYSLFPALLFRSNNTVVIFFEIGSSFFSFILFKDIPRPIPFIFVISQNDGIPLSCSCSHRGNKPTYCHV